VILQKTCESTTEGDTTMTVDPNSIDLPAFLAEHLQRAEPDLAPIDAVHVRGGVDVGRGRRDLRRPLR
jgi:hypothetical protein